MGNDELKLITVSKTQLSDKFETNSPHFAMVTHSRIARTHANNAIRYDWLSLVC